MKESGKGGKLNVIDVVILLVLVAAIALVAVKFFSKEPETLGSENALTAPNLRFTVVCEEIPQELAENVKSSLQGEAQNVSGNMVEMTRLFNSNRLVDARIVSAESEANGDGVDLRLTIEANALISSGAYTVGTQEARVGRDFNVKTLNVEIKGVIFTMEKLS